MFQFVAVKVSVLDALTPDREKGASPWPVIPTVAVAVGSLDRLTV